MRKKTNQEFLEELKLANSSTIALSEYINSSTKIEVKCLKCGNIWQTLPDSLLSGHGCPVCANNQRKTHKQFLKELKSANPNTIALSEYINSSTKIEVKCLKCGNIWKVLPHSLLRGHGCPACAKNQKKTHEQFLSETENYNPHIEILGKYKTSQTPIRVKCRICGNEWIVKPNRLLRGAQCTNCTRPHTSFMEQFILLCFKTVLGEEKVQSRNTSAIGMELDIFIPSYNLAIEPGSWLYHQKKANNLDIKKREKCQKKGIRLITIYDTYPIETAMPFEDNCYVFDGYLNEYKNERLINLVQTIFMECGIHTFNLDWNRIAIEAYEACHYNANEQFLNEMSKAYPNIEVLENFQGSHIPILVKNKDCDHPAWKARPYTLLKGIGCPECGKSIAATKHTRLHEQFLAELKIISPSIIVLGTYSKATDRIDVKCETCGYQWSPLAYSLLSGKGCPHCSALKGAKQRNGKLRVKTTEQFKSDLKKVNGNIEILGEYINNKTKIHAKCGICDYEWNVVPASLLNGHGCPKCSRKNRKKSVHQSSLP